MLSEPYVHCRFAHRRGGTAVECSGLVPIDARDVDEKLRELRSAQPVGPVVTHRRCGATCRVEFLHEGY